MFPESAQRISSSVGFGFSFRNAVAVSIIPGVQKPHCRPCSSWNACWIGCRPSAVCSPSTVVTSCPPACTAKTVHDFTGVPSSNTVHAPHDVVSQPRCVPVRPSVSRRKCVSSSRVSTSAECAVPLTVSVSALVIVPSRTETTSVMAPPFGHLTEASLGEHAHDVALLLNRAADVVLRLGGLGGEPRRFLDRPVVELRAREHLLGLG